MTVNVRPKGPIRNRNGLPIREGGVRKLSRHERWLVKNGSLEIVENDPVKAEKPKADAKKKEVASNE